MNTKNQHIKKNFTLVEISLAVFILAVGVCSILSIFPVAMSWGGETIASGSGSAAALSTVAVIEEMYNGTTAGTSEKTLMLNSSDPTKPDTDLQIIIGDTASTENNFYCRAQTTLQPFASETNGRENLFVMTIKAYRRDWTLSSLSATERDKILNNPLVILTSYVYDRP